MKNSLKSWAQNLTEFDGRSQKADYWWAFLASLIAMGTIQVLALPSILSSAALAPNGPLILPDIQIAHLLLLMQISVSVFCLLMLAIIARRFQDTNRSGNWFRIMFYLTLGGLILSIVFYIAHLFTSVSNVWPILILFAPYASVIWTFWIGFFRSDPNPNQYGPNPNEVPS